jgi:hypothetical protein
MLGAFELLVRLGRNFGVGSTLVTQRPQSVHKEVLSQAEVLVLLQIAGAHERRAIEEWINAHGATARKRIVADLTELAVGEAYVWSPSWLRLLERVTISRIDSYDSSATPELGDDDRPVLERLPALDVDGIKAALEDDGDDADDGPTPAEASKRGGSESPAPAGNVEALRQRIAELEESLERAEAVTDLRVEQGCASRRSLASCGQRRSSNSAAWSPPSTCCARTCPTGSTPACSAWPTTSPPPSSTSLGSGWAPAVVVQSPGSGYVARCRRRGGAWM